MIVSSFATSEPRFHQSEIEFVVSDSIILSTVEDTFLHQVEPTMALGLLGEIFVGFKNSETHDGGGAAVSYTHSRDNGATWSIPEFMPSLVNSSRQSDPWMNFFNGTLYYTYLDFHFNFDGTLNESSITMARSTNHGTNWNLTKVTNNTGFADKESFTIDSDGIIYLVYDDILSVKIETEPTLIKLSRSFDGGQTFYDNVTIMDSNSSNFLGPYILAVNSPGELFTSWTYLGITPDDSDIYYDHSTDYGETWGIDKKLNQVNASYFTQSDLGRPKIVTLSVLEEDQNGRIYVLWEDLFYDKSTFDVFMRYSDDKGKTWSDRELVNDQTEGNQWNEDMEIDSSGNVHFLYYSDAGNNEYNIRYRVYFPDLDKFSEEIIVSSRNTSADLSRPGDYSTIRLDSQDTAHLVWSDGRSGEMDIYYTQIRQVKQTSNENSSLSGQSQTIDLTSNILTTTSSSPQSSSETSTEDSTQTEILSLMIIFLYPPLKRKGKWKQ